MPLVGTGSQGNSQSSSSRWPPESVPGTPALRSAMHTVDHSCSLINPQRQARSMIC